MVKQSIISGVFAGVLYTLFMWLGDVFYFKQEVAFHIYLIQGAVFTIAMSAVYYFIYKRRNKNNKK